MKAYLQKNIARNTYATLIGATLTLAFAPFSYGMWAWGVIALFLFGISTCNTRAQSLWFGFWFGFGLFASGASWIYVSIHDFGPAPFWLATLFTTSFVALWAATYTLIGWATYAMRPHPLWLFTGFPLTWVAIEGFRYHFGTGFPWLNLGDTQIDTVIGGYLPVLGVYGTTGVTVLLGALLYKIFEAKRNRYFFLAFVLIGSVLQTVHWTQPIGKPQTVALLQGNIPQMQRWNRHFLTHIIETYQTLTKANLNHDFIIWPEGALPLPFPNNKALLASLDALAKNHQTNLFIGMPIIVDGKYYNGVVGQGLASGVYLKRHLVPFGEYVPFENYLRGLIAFFDLPMSDFYPAPTTMPPLLEAYNLKVGPSICYEIAYSDLVRTQTKDAHVLLTLSNDAWFGNSLGPDQHLTIARIRAKETGRYVLRATNNGWTAIINPQGIITALLAKDTTGALTGTFEGMQGQTPWQRFGYLPGLLLSILWGALCWKMSLPPKVKRPTSALRDLG